MVAGLSAHLLEVGVDYVGSIRVELAAGPHKMYLLPLFGMLGGLFAGFCVQFLAPEAYGSGIPQVRAALDRVQMPLNLRVALVKFLGGTVALGSGLFLGREGPTVQLGASVSSAVAKLIPTTAEHRRQLIAAGAGAGLAAAFTAPLAGVAFVLEELLREMKPITILITLSACASASLVTGVLSSQHLRTVLHSVRLDLSMHPFDMPFYVALGVFAGAAAAFFNFCIMCSLKLNQSMPLPLMVRTGLAGLFSGWLITQLPATYHNYAGIRALIATGTADPDTVITAFAAFFFMTVVAYGSGAPGGLFAPSLVLGSAIGYLVGLFELTLTGADAVGAFSLVGMGAFFSGVARVPLTATIITFELTNHFALVVPLMVSSVLASMTAELLYPGSLYDLLMNWNGIALRANKPMTEIMSAMRAKDVMQTVVPVFSADLKVKDVLPTFAAAGGKGYPILKGKKLVGVITQTDIGRILQLASVPENLTIASVMTRSPVSVSPHDSLEDILYLFTRDKYSWLPVCNHDIFLGTINQSDVVESLFSELNREEKVSEEKSAL